MSSSEQPPKSPAEPAPPAARSGGSGCLNVFLILLGIVMLLPGLCAVLFITLDWKSALSGSNLSAMVAFLAIGAGGIFLIGLAIKGLRA
jgi:hypothetical protein